MKIIQLGGNVEAITVDLTEYTVDSTLITVDATQIGSPFVQIIFTPRFFIGLEERLIVKFRNELTNELFLPIYHYNFVDGYFNLFVDRSIFTNQTKYEFEVLTDAKEYIYKGKAIALVKGEDEIQNYSLVDTSNNKLKF